MGSDVRIALVAVGFSWNFQRTMQAQLHKLVQPPQSLIEVALVRRHEKEFERDRLLRLLDGDGRPTAVISLAFRPDPLTVTAYQAAGIPFVLVDEQVAGASTVACDNFKCGYLAGKHLLGKGRRTPALICGDSTASGDYNAVQRRRGFEKALTEAGVSLQEGHVHEVLEYSRKDGVAALEKFLGGGPRPDAVFSAAGDAPASGLLAAARERRIKVPEDLAVISVDDMPLASITEPPLTTFRQPVEAIAREAWRLATGETAALLDRPKTVLLDPTLIGRGSA